MRRSADCKDFHDSYQWDNDLSLLPPSSNDNTFSFF